MKKIYTLIATVAVVLSANAQVRQVNGAPEKTTGVSKLQPVTNLSNFSASLSNSRAYSGWMNYAFQLDDPAGFTPGLATASFMLIFPDSLPITGQYVDLTTARPQFHKAATMLDPKNMPVIGIAATDAYSLDSIGIVYGYLRSLGSSVVDTLRVNIIKDDAALLWDLTAETYQDITYVFSTDKITASQIIGSYDYYLTDADSSDTAAELFIKTILPTQAAGKRIGAVITFKPGFSYTATDSIQDLNSFYLLSYEQNGDGGGTGTDPVFNGNLSDGTSDMNCSYALPTDVRYNFNANGWNGYFIPTWAWTTPYAYEHHIIEFKISNPPLAIAEFDNGAKLGQSMPNPSTGLSTIRYELEKNARVALNVYDVTGKVVATENIGEQNSGAHTMNFNAENLSAGVYYYSLTVNNATTASMKMVVIK